MVDGRFIAKLQFVHRQPLCKMAPDQRKCKRDHTSEILISLFSFALTGLWKPYEISISPPRCNSMKIKFPSKFIRMLGHTIIACKHMVIFTSTKHQLTSNKYWNGFIFKDIPNVLGNLTRNWSLSDCQLCLSHRQIRCHSICVFLVWECVCTPPAPDKLFLRGDYSSYCGA